jgi:ubiquinone/menaquinone biosynthesis C-methylase UbiE
VPGYNHAVRTIDDAAIGKAGAIRRRSEYDYTHFEYLRSAKIVASIERGGVSIRGRVLDNGCGPGGTALSLAEETGFVVGLDLDARFRNAGIRFAKEKGIANAAFVRGDGSRLPFPDASFDLVLSHSVIEHVVEAERYFQECFRVLRPGGGLYLSTQPYLSLTGCHLPRLKVPIPVHLLVGRRAALAIFRILARRAPWTLRDPRESNTWILLAEQGKPIPDSLAQRITVARVTWWAENAGFRLVRQDLHLTGFFRRFVPGLLRRPLARTPGTQDIMIGHIECVLAKP